MLRRTLLIKLKPEHALGLPAQKILRTAQTSLGAAYGVQNVLAEHAVDEETRSMWDLIITIVYVSGVDEKRSSNDPIRKAFEENFLGPRAERVWSGLFASQP